MMSKIAFYHGRFQPFHNGHLKVIKLALSECKLLIIGISNPFRFPPVIDYKMNKKALIALLKARDPLENPWPYWARLLMIRNGLKSEGISLESVLFIPNVYNSSLPEEEIHIPKELTKIYICPKQSHNKAKLDFYLKNNWDVRVIKPTKNMYSAESIRKKIRYNEEWESFVPSGTAKTIKLLSKGELKNIVDDN